MTFHLLRHNLFKSSIPEGKEVQMPKHLQAVNIVDVFVDMNMVRIDMGVDLNRNGRNWAKSVRVDHVLDVTIDVTAGPRFLVLEIKDVEPTEESLRATAALYINELMNDYRALSPAEFASYIDLTVDEEARKAAMAESSLTRAQERIAALSP